MWLQPMGRVLFLFLFKSDYGFPLGGGRSVLGGVTGLSISLGFALSGSTHRFGVDLYWLCTIIHSSIRSTSSLVSASRYETTRSETNR